eukprot:6205441-Pleurochrysis_carterae.AAC.8
MLSACCCVRVRAVACECVLLPVFASECGRASEEWWNACLNLWRKRALFARERRHDVDRVRK